MSIYSRTKKISKYLIYFSVIAVSLSLVTFLYEKNQISADSDPEAEERVKPKNTGYKIVPNGSGGVDYILAKDIDSSALHNCKNFFYTLVTKHEGNECSDLESNECYKLTIPNYPANWKYASFDRSNLTPDLSFLEKMYQKVERFADTGESNYELKYRQDKGLLDQVYAIYDEANSIATDSELANRNYWFETVLNQPRKISLMRYYHPNLHDGIQSPNITPEAGAYLTMSAISWQDPQIPSEDWDLLGEAYLKARFKGSSSDMDKIKKIQRDYQSAVRDNPSNKLDYLITEDAGIIKLYLINASAPALREHQENYDDLIWKDGQLDGIRIDHSGYWELTDSGQWDDASLEKPYTPQWSFLNEINHRTKQTGDSVSEEKVTGVIRRYIANAYNEWDNVKFVPPSSSTSIEIKDQNFFDYLLQKFPGISECGDNCEFKKIDGTDAIILDLNGSYEGATKNSVWHQSMLYLLNSALKAWEDVGWIMTAERNFVERQLEIYLSIIEKRTATSEMLSLEYPKEIYLDNSNLDSYLFTIKTDPPELEPEQDGRFVVKIFMKPYKQKSENIYITSFSTVRDSDLVFSWSDLSNMSYSNTDLTNQGIEEYIPEFEDGESYNTSFPQKYYFKAQLSYQGDETEEAIDEVDATFETVGDINLTNGYQTNRTIGDYFTILGPASARQKEKIPVTVIAKDEQIKKAILYVCTGTKEEVMASDSSQCTHVTDTDSRTDSIKGTMAIPELISSAGNFGSTTTNWKVMTFDSNGESEVTFDWDTSGSIVGYHSLMVKGFSGDGNDYISNSKTVIGIAISDIDGPESQSDRETNSGLVEFGSSFFDINQPITSLSSLFSRIKSIFYWLVGILAFAAIIYGGFQYMTAGGNPEAAANGQKTILYAVIGLALAALAYGIVATVVDIINQIFSKL